jgi:Bacterial type II/III secretion system short domain
LAAVLAEQAVSATVPVPLVTSLLTMAAAGDIPAKVAALTQGVLKTMLIMKLKAMSPVVLLLGLAGTGTGWAYYHGAMAGQPTPASVSQVQGGNTKQPTGEQLRQENVKLKQRLDEALAQLKDTRALPAGQAQEKQEAEQAAGLIKPHAPFKLKYARAVDVAQVLMAVYREQMNYSQNLGLMRNRATRGGPPASNQQPDASMPPRPSKLSIGVDEQTNSIVVACTEAMYKEIWQLVEELEQAAKDQAALKRLVLQVYSLREFTDGATLVAVITTTINPPSWSVQGGDGTIIYVPEVKSLVIKQSVEIHKEIQGLLDALREAKRREPEAKAKSPGP